MYRFTLSFLIAFSASTLAPGSIAQVVENRENVSVSENVTNVENVTINVTKIQEEIDRTGSAAIYGLEFAFNSAEILPASKPVLEAMADYLVGNPSQTILLVGHTDNVGTLPVNLDLSQKRSKAVLNALVDGFKIPPTQLEAHGVGFLAPRQPNTTAEGRAHNRRVEMVPR
ncbi:MAG: OmpA family protein [Pseudomonadota bacterium]